MKSEREKLQKEKDQVGREGNSKAGNQKGKTFFLEGTLNDKKWQKKKLCRAFPHSSIPCEDLCVGPEH